MSSFKVNSRLFAAGFSLVEIMVAMVVGLIGMIVVFQVFAVFEGQKRTATSGGDAQQNGSLALFAIEREARVAGFGINYATLAGCKVLADDSGRSFNFTMSAAQIVDGAAGAPDTITFVYGNSSALVSSVAIMQPAPAAGNIYVVDNPFGIAVGDAAILAEAGKDCTLSTVTAIASTNLSHDVGSYTDVNGVAQTARYNKAGGLGVDYSIWNVATKSGGRLFDFGPSPTVVTYSLNTTTSQLEALYLLRSITPTAIVDGIVQLQAEYGKDTNNDGVVDAWNTTLPTTAATWAQVLALRLVIVARSGQPERAVDSQGNPTGGPCNATTVGPTTGLTTNAGVIDLSADANWKCYRYKTFETVVPIRNQIWAPL
jgi:type IV pilus assembly protein PilW